MPNNRVFYASHAVSVNGTTVQGAQSVAVNTNFNLEQVFQLGRLAVYDNVPLDPEVEVTINKALDGHDLIWTLMTNGLDSAGSSLVQNANTKSEIILGVGNDTDAFIGENGGVSAILMSGCFLSSVNYTIPVDGNFTEEVTFLGTNKSISGSITAPTEDPIGGANPAVLRRQNFNKAGSNLPTEVDNKRISQITISADLGREAIYELGRFEPYHRFVNFPLEITVAFDVIADDHDGFAVDASTASDCSSPDDVAVEQDITIALCTADGSSTYYFDLGNKCTLQSIGYSGGDTGGGNVTITYTYVTYNTLDIT
jgi:hypothetical protein